MQPMEPTLQRKLEQRIERRNFTIGLLMFSLLFSLAYSATAKARGRKETRDEVLQIIAADKAKQPENKFRDVVTEYVREEKEPFSRAMAEYRRETAAQALAKRSTTPTNPTSK